MAQPDAAAKPHRIDVHYHILPRRYFANERAKGALMGAVVPLIGQSGDVPLVQRFAPPRAVEDQMWPKKCGHYQGGRPVIARAEARIKIRAAVEEAQDADILVLARTDARGSLGFDEAKARLKAFEEEGADILFAEALESVEEMKVIGGAFKKPTVASMMPKTPVASRESLRAMGFKIVAYNVLLGAAIKAMQDTLAAFKADRMDTAPPRITMDQIAQLAGLNDYNRMEQRYAPAEAAE